MGLSGTSPQATLLALACTAIGTLSAAQDRPLTGPVLALDAGGHTATVRRVLFAPDAKELITLSDDKTIRVWDVATGESLRVIRPPIGRGPEGKLYAAAISPDGTLLAVGGFGFQAGNKHPIYIIALEQGVVTRVLTGHSNVILDLAFSRDGRRLISGSSDNTARVWNLVGVQDESVLDGHGGAVVGVVFSPDGSQCATASLDRTAIVWSVATGTRAATLLGHAAEVNAIDWSADGRQIATGSDDGSIRVWTPQGESVRTLDRFGDRFLKSVRFTPDGERILFAANSMEAQDQAGLINASTGAITLTFNEHTNSILDARLSPDRTVAATAGGNNHETWLWSTETGEVQITLAARSRTPWAVVWSNAGQAIAWGETNEGRIIEAANPLERSFDLERLEFRVTDARGEPLIDQFRESQWRRAQSDAEGLSLAFAGGTKLEVRQSAETLAVLQPKDEYHRLYDEVRCFTMLPKGRVAVGSNYGLRLYEGATGKQFRDCVGHTGEVWAVAPSPDGRYLLSASQDMTFCVWNLQAAEKGPLTPLLSLYFAGEDWIAWTPDGYYAASPGGERLMGWHVNNDLDELASFYPATQFRKQFFRPDVIGRLLEFGSVEKALDAVGQREDVTQVEDHLPPRVEIISPDKTEPAFDGTELNVKVVVHQVGDNRLKTLQLLINGRPFGGPGGIVRLDDGTPTAEHTFRVPLEAGTTYQFQARADTGVSYGISDAVKVTTTSNEPDVIRPSLYVLAIGVADYDDTELTLNFADDDARNLVDAIRKHGEELYRKIEVRLLVDKNATGRGILSGLAWLKSEMTQHDVGIVFYSGHGGRDENTRFYLLPCDVDRKLPLLVTGVSDEQIKSTLQVTPGRLLLILDACHAATLQGDRRKADSSLTENLTRDLVADDYGIVVMSSSGGREFSLESPEHKSGMFTRAIVEGLTGSADFNQDTAIYLNELDAYVTERVKELTRGRQHPYTAKPGTIRSFPLTRITGAE